MKLGKIRNDETRGRRRRRCSHIRGEVAERRVLLMAHGRDDGDGALGERPHDDLGAERQEIVEAAAAAGDDHDVDRRVRCDALHARLRLPPGRPFPARASR